jgi:hypothetical protein
VEEISPHDACRAGKDACKQAAGKGAFEKALARAQQAEIKRRHKVTAR